MPLHKVKFRTLEPDYLGSTLIAVVHELGDLGE